MSPRTHTYTDEPASVDAGRWRRAVGRLSDRVVDFDDGSSAAVVPAEGARPLVTRAHAEHGGSRSDGGGWWLILLCPLLCCGVPLAGAGVAALGAATMGGVGAGVVVLVGAVALIVVRRRRTGACARCEAPAQRTAGQIADDV